MVTCVWFMSENPFICTSKNVRYVKRLHLPMDVASTLPFQFIYRIITGKNHQAQFLGFLNLLRLWRLRRVSALFKRYMYCIIYIFVYIPYMINTLLFKLIGP